MSLLRKNVIKRLFCFHSDVYGGRTGAEGSAHSTARLLRSAAEHPGIAWAALKAPSWRCSPPAGWTPCCWRKTAAAFQNTPSRTPPSSAHQSQPLSTENRLVNWIILQIAHHRVIHSEYTRKTLLSHSTRTKNLTAVVKPERVFTMNRGISKRFKCSSSLKNIYKT